MSIAVSAVIKPSRLLRVALSVYAAASAGAAMALVLGPPGRFHSPWLLAGACLLASLVAARAARAATTTHGIDISGLGEIRLTVQHSIDATPDPREALRLLPGSTVWPGLLLLLLAAPAPAGPTAGGPRQWGLLQGGPRQGAVTVLVILPDSVPPEQFRNIAVSINVIARRDNKFFRKNKIL